MDIEPPSPKRARFDPPHAESLQPTAEISNPGTPFDDADDLYGSPAESTRKSNADRSSETQQINPPGSPELKKAFFLPGLGHSASGQERVATSSSTNDIGALIESTSTNPVHLGNLGDANGAYKLQAKKDGDSMSSYQGSSSETRDQEKDTTLDNVKGATGDVPAIPASTAMPPSIEMATEQSIVLPAQEIGGPLLNTSIFGPNMNIDVASLSEELPAVAEDSAVGKTGPSRGSSTTHERGELEEHVESIVEFENQKNEKDAAGQSQIPDDTRTLKKVDLFSQTNLDTADASISYAQAEFEVDSSPIESSSSESSSTTSSSDDSDDYEMLSPEEQARRLMQEDVGSEDEGQGKSGNGTLSGPLRTTNEKPDEIVPKPDLLVTSDMKIQELGDVEVLVENLAVIKAKTSGEYQVLEMGSVLCLDDRSVIGVVAETLGRVQQPYYTVRFTNTAAIAEAGLSKGTKVCYVEQHSTTVFTQPLKAYKGSDASNLHDEEVGDDEMEFSDDEKEAEHKRRLKQAKQARRGGRQADSDGFSKGPGRGSESRGKPGYCEGRFERGPRNYDASDSVSYDDLEVDGPYNPLARPTNLHEIMGSNEAPMETHINGNSSHRGGHRGRGAADRGRGRARGDRGRARGDGRGGRRGHDVHRSPANGDRVAPSWNDTSQVQHSPTYGYPQHHNIYATAHYPAQQSYASNVAVTQAQSSATSLNYNNYQQQPPTFQTYNNHPAQPSQPHIPPGAFVNPAFFSQSPQGSQHTADNHFRQN